MDILRISEELQSLINTGTRLPGFRRKVLVDIDRLVALGEEFSTSVPASIHEAQEILKQKQSIVNQAYLEAQRIKSGAEHQATELKTAAEQEHESKVDESEVVKSSEAKAIEIQAEAAAKAQQILQDAQRNAYENMNKAETIAKNRRDGADQYAREILFNLEEQMADQLGQVRRGIDAMRLEEEVQVREARLAKSAQPEQETEQKEQEQPQLLHQAKEPVEQRVSA